MCVAQRENESNNPSRARGEEGKKLQSICRVVASHSLSLSLPPARNVLNISLWNIFPVLLVAILRQLKIPRSLLFARGGGGGGFLCIGSQERKRLLQQITNSLICRLPCQHWKDHIPAKPWKDLRVINQILQPPSHLTPTHKIYVQLIYFRKIWLVLHVWLNWLNVYISALLIWVCGRIEPPHNQIAHSRNQHLDHTR